MALLSHVAALPSVEHFQVVELSNLADIANPCHSCFGFVHSLDLPRHAKLRLLLCMTASPRNVGKKRKARGDRTS